MIYVPPASQKIGRAIRALAASERPLCSSEIGAITGDSVSTGDLRECQNRYPGILTDAKQGRQAYWSVTDGARLMLSQPPLPRPNTVLYATLAILRSVRCPVTAGDLAAQMRRPEIATAATLTALCDRWPHLVERTAPNTYQALPVEMPPMPAFSDEMRPTLDIEAICSAGQWWKASDVECPEEGTIEHALLLALHDGPMHARDLMDSVDVPRHVAARALDTLRDEYPWLVRRDRRTYHLHDWGLEVTSAHKERERLTAPSPSPDYPLGGFEHGEVMM